MDNTAQNGENLETMYLKFYQERGQLQQADRQSFFMSWEGKFWQAIADSSSDAPARWGLMEALIGIQIELGKNNDALKTSEEMESYAKKAGVLEKQVVARSYRIQLLADKPIEIIMEEAANIDAIVNECAKQAAATAARENCSDVLYRIGVLLATRAIADPQGGNTAMMLDTAMNALERSTTWVNNDSPAYAARMFWLAQAQSRLGFQAEAAASYEKLAKVKQSGFSRLWIECLRICEITTRDSPEYQAALERALADAHERGDVDEYEVTIRHLLGVSYRNAKQYTKSTEILSANAGKRGDPDLLANDMVLIALNARDTKDIATAKKTLEEVAAAYPKTGSGLTAQGELKRIIYQPLPPAEAAVQMPKRGILIGANLAAIVIFVAVFVGRQVRGRSLRHSGS
jgi:tetratricopeptide (TPR) repeat protein